MLNDIRLSMGKNMAMNAVSKCLTLPTVKVSTYNLNFIHHTVKVRNSKYFITFTPNITNTIIKILMVKSLTKAY